MRGRKRVAVVLLLAAVGWAVQRSGWLDRGGAEPTESGVAAIEDAFRAQRSGVWVEGQGTVAKLLRDDRQGDQHQQWLLRLDSGHTLKFAHNFDLAPYIKSLREGDRIRFRGRYEYNAKGGVIHWTHHDPQRRRAGGWIEHSGKRYE